MTDLNALWRIAEQSLERGGHDLSHVRRVYRLSEKLAKKLPCCDLEILSAAVILHDIARFDEDNDPSGQLDHAAAGAERARELLIRQGFTPERAELVSECILTHRYRNSGLAPGSIEARILYDADKLDSLGAVGVARTFMLSGQYGEQLYITPPEDLETGGDAPKIFNFAEYSPNLEYLVKLRHIPDRLFTEPAREYAKVLMKRMDKFFEELREELEI